MNIREIRWMSAGEMAQLIKSKQLSPVEVVESLLAAIQVVNPRINAIVTLTAESALAEARDAEKALMKKSRLGRLHGVPFLVKDVTWTKGVRTTMCSRLMENFIPNEDAVHVWRLKRAGAILLGKTNTPEFATKSVTDNLLFGRTRNPWDLDKTTGGSSGGSAAAVAAGLVPLATGNDAGGSIRSPASLCGVFGIKPQYGRIPIYPPFQSTMFHEGAITWTVGDAALMLDVMAGPHWGDRSSLPRQGASYVKSLDRGIKGLRVAWSPNLGYASVSRQVLAVCQQALRKFAEAGVQVEEVGPDCRGMESTETTIVNAELAARLSAFGPFESIRDRLDPFVAGRMAQAQNISAADYLNAISARQEFAARVGRFFEDFDLLLTPVSGVPAWPLGLPGGGSVTEIDGKPISRLGWQLSFPFNLTGQPAASIPAGFTEDGLPVGLQIVARRFEESTLFRAARVFEQVNPWADRKPPIAGSI